MKQLITFLSFLFCVPLLSYELAIVAIFRDEAFYLKEWIEYHRMAGVDRFCCTTMKASTIGETFYSLISNMDSSRCLNGQPFPSETVIRNYRHTKMESLEPEAKPNGYPH